MALETTKRINVTFPVSLLEDIRRLMPSRQRNKFIPTGHDVVEATQKQLAQIQLQSALAESAGAWSDEDYPELQSVSDVNHYVRQLREGPQSPVISSSEVGPVTSHIIQRSRTSPQSPVPSHQSYHPAKSGQSPVTSPQSPVTSLLPL